VSEEPDIRAEFCAAMMNAVLDVARSPTGDGSSFNPEDVRQALAIMAAAFIEADPVMRTAKDLREAAEVFGRDLRIQLRAQRAAFEATGEHVLGEMTSASVQ
jgi:hypothetical protein